jgi:hypothetical protein
MARKKGVENYDIQEHIQAAERGGYITIPSWGYPGHEDWAPGTRQWIPPGSPSPSELQGLKEGATGAAGATDSSGINDASGGMGGGLNYDAVRARAIAPSRAMYQNSIRRLNQQKGLGISSPGYGAQMAKLNRGMSQSMSDASIGAEASVADMMLRDKALNQESILRNRALDIEQKRLPTASQTMTNDIQGWLNLASTGAGIYGTIANRRQPQQGGTTGGTTGGYGSTFPQNMSGGGISAPSGGFTWSGGSGGFGGGGTY